MVIIELGRVYYQLFYISVGQKSPIGTFVLFPIPSTHLANLTFHTVCLYFFFYLTLSSPVISSFHFLSALVVSGPHRKCHGPPCPPCRCLSSLIYVSFHTCKLCAVSRPRRGTAVHTQVSPPQQEVILPIWLFFFLFSWFFCIPSQIIHPSPTCSWSHTHTAATT